MLMYVFFTIDASKNAEEEKRVNAGETTRYCLVCIMKDFLTQFALFYCIASMSVD